jgi:hypothetical protein
LRIAIIAKEEARTYRLHHSVSGPDYYEGFLSAVDVSRRFWEAASEAWKEYDEALAQYRCTTGKTNRELWTTDPDD